MSSLNLELVAFFVRAQQEANRVRTLSLAGASLIDPVAPVTGPSPALTPRDGYASQPPRRPADGMLTC